MADQLKDVLLNIMFIILPLFLYQIFFMDRFMLKKRHNQIAVGLTGATSILLCMSFPFAQSKGFFIDLKLIPLLLSTLYGGFSVGLILSLLIIVYRMFLGGIGCISIFIIYSTLLPILYRTIPKYHRFSLHKKLLFTTSVSISVALVSSLFYLFLNDLPLSRLVYRIDTILLQALLMFLATFMVERLRENIVLKEMIHRTEKLQVVSEMAASVSHEIRNPLTVTRGFIQLMLQSSDIPREKQAVYLQLSLEVINRAQAIITDYLALAKPQLDSKHPLIVTDEIKYVVDVMAPYATMHDIEVVCTLNDPCSIIGDRQKFHQCLINLVKNGIEAMPDGGILSITSNSQKNQVQIEIKDSGVGMTKEQVSRLGTPYYSTKEKGTGLGTMVAFHIVHAFNGKIQVYSQEGEGTNFIINIPLAE